MLDALVGYIAYWAVGFGVANGNVIVPGGSRPDPKESLAFRCDLQFQSPVRAKPVGRL